MFCALSQRNIVKEGFAPTSYNMYTKMATNGNK